MAGAKRDRGGEFNERVIAEFRANEGRVGGELADTSILLLHHLGARSARQRVTPLAYSQLADGRIVLVASNGGSPTHPGWYHNVKANPQITVEIGTERFTTKAEELDGAARAGVWAELTAAAPAIAEFQAKTTRQIPVFALTPREPPDRASHRDARPPGSRSTRS